MKIRVLGSSGGISNTQHTTCLQLNDNALIDAGTGMRRLTADEMQEINHVFLTHSHLDHVALLPLLVDAQAISGDNPLNVYGSQDTIKMIREHMFNNKIWPDMENIHIKGRPGVIFHTLKPFQRIDVRKVSITPLPVDHGIPTFGYCLHGEKENFVFCTDMIDAPKKFWDYLHALENFKRMSIEISFQDDLEPLARVSFHLTPKMLLQLKKDGKIPPGVKLYYNHTKVKCRDKILKDIQKISKQISLTPFAEGKTLNI